MICIDFETEGIAGNPTVRPPRPVGVALKRAGFKARYLAWGHPEGNNCTFEQARGILADYIYNQTPLLFHNSKFDMAVMEHHMALKVHNPLLVHDTIFQVFLHDPYADSFALKPSASRILGIPPDEQDLLRAWILGHVQCKPSEWGAHIAKAPVSIVGPYAKGDVDRTLALYQHLVDKVPLGPYQREQRLRPIVMESEARGVLCSIDKLGTDVKNYEKALRLCEDRVRKLLKAPSVNLDSGEELANALDKAGMITQWVLTPTGRRSTARGALERSVTDPTLLPLLRYRGALTHCLSSFARPWLELAQDYNGRLHPEWNQVRQSKGDSKDAKGTRTGRLSCSKPNFQNPPNEYDITVPRDYPALPIMREYLVPDEGYVWLKRDYSQQELRILANYSEGRLYQRYQENPRIDAHQEVGALILEHAGVELERKFVKTINFGIIYGTGIPALAAMLGVSTDEAATTKTAYLFALPEVKVLMDTCKERGRNGQTITTWGGRDYLVEPPKIVKGRRWTFEYKLLNYLIQGSAADQTKESIIRWDGDKGNGQFLCTVHDETNIQAPKETWKADMALLRKAMSSIEFDVKMLSDGYVGSSWANLKKLVVK